jgi:hypothetical protein
MDEYVAKRLQILGRVQAILFEGIMGGQISNSEVNNAEKFRDVWLTEKDENYDLLWNRICLIERSLFEAYELVYEKSEDEDE